MTLGVFRVMNELSELLTVNTRRIIIYGLFDGARCRYVGQTRSRKRREQVWRGQYPTLRFEVITECSWGERNLIERQTVQGFLKIGQCDLNKKLVPGRYISTEADRARARRAAETRKLRLMGCTSRASQS